MASTIKVTNIDTPDSTGNITVDRPLSGSGASLTSLPAANLTGTIAAISGANLTALNATQLTSGTLPMARLSGTLPALNGSALTNLPASSVTTKVISTSYNLSTASGNQDITGFGFNPSALFHISLVNNSDDWSHGFTDFTTNRTVHTKNTTYAELQGTGSLMRAYISSGNTQDGTVTVITDGIRIAWTKAGSPTGTYTQYLIGFK